MAGLLVAPTWVSTKSTASTAPSGRDFTRFDAYFDLLGVIFHSDPQLRAGTGTLPTQAERQDVGNNPLEQRPQFGQYFAQGDFSSGALQSYFHRPTRDDAAYLRSEGFDISDPGVLRHLNQTLEANNTSLTDPGALAQVGGLPFVTQTNRVWRGNGSFPGTWTAEDPHLAEGNQTVEDLAASGAELYAAVGTNGIHLRASAGTWTHYVNAGANPITRIAWAKDRLMAADGRKIYEITASGALPAAIETLVEGWTFTEIFESGPFIFACASNLNAGLSRVHTYGLNSAATAMEKKTSTALPKGDIIKSGIGYLGKIFLGGGRANKDGGYDPVVYEAAPADAGDLSLLLIHAGKGAAATDLSVLAMESIPDTVLFGWSLPAADVAGERCGLAARNLGRSAFYHHLAAATPAARINGVMLYKGRVLFSVAGQGLYYEDLGTPVAQATLVTSIADWNNAGSKAWDLVEILHSPLVVGTTVEVLFTKKHPDEKQWEQAFLNSLPGSQGFVERIEGISSRLFALQLVSYANQSNAPEIRSYSVRSNPAPDTVEFSLTRYVRILASDRKDSRAEPIRQNPRTVRAAIQDMAYTWLTFYEPGFTWKVFVQSVADAQPQFPVVDQTSGDALKEAYTMEIRMIASRQG